MDRNNSEKVIVNQDLIQAYRITLEEFKNKLNKMNEMWFSTIRLIITLSTSILLVSVSLIDKIFPLDSSPLFIKNILIFGWVLLFLSLIFGIITELKGAEFYGKAAKDYEPILKNYLLQITKGQFGQQEIDLRQNFVLYSSLFWGLSAIVLFIFAILCLSIYSIGNICDISICTVVAILSAVFIILGLLILVYFKNR